MAKTVCRIKDNTHNQWAKVLMFYKQNKKGRQ